MLEVGSLIAGKLRVERVLGRGGMGTVIIATHLKLDQQVAIKILHTELCGDVEVIERFVREARASARLRSEHVCRVSDVGQLETGEPYIEMELLDGSDLANVIAGQPLTVAAAVEYVLQACVAVAEAHALGIIHRDLKPANLFVTRRLDGSALIKVLDFGIATAPSAGDFKITKTTTVMGSPGYMSPEHLRSARDVDARSDIWALGCILYEAVSGRLPFDAASITELAVKVVIDPPTPLAPDLDPRYAAIVMKCLEKSPADRYQTVAELAADLATLGTPTDRAIAALIARIAGGTAPAPSRPVTVPAVAFAPTTLHTAAGQATPPARRRGLALAAGVGVLVLVGGAVAAFAVLGGGSATHGSDAAIVAVRVPDAAIVAADAAVDTNDDRAAIRAMVHELAEQHDWRAILTMSGLDPGDPEIADARQHYLAQQMQVVDGLVAHGQCAHAKETATAAAKLVPDDATLAAKAKTCTPHVVPVGPVSDLDAANDAYDRQEFAKALGFAEKAVAKEPGNPEAVRIAALSACASQSADQAKDYFAKLAPKYREVVTVVCAENHVALAPPPPPPPPPLDPAAEAELARDMMQARNALRGKRYKLALELADKVLKTRPHMVPAMSIVGEAACRLHDAKRVKATLALAAKNLGVTQTIVRVCSDEGVPLD